MPFPVIKLFSILVKQLSKPMSVYLKRKAKENYFLRTYICMPPAQAYHRIDVKLKMWVAGIKGGSNFKIQPLTEEMAIDTGAELLGEAFIFSVAAGLVALEYWRQAAAQARKEKKNEVCVIQLQNDVNTLKEAVQTNQKVLDMLNEHMTPNTDTGTSKTNSEIILANTTQQIAAVAKVESEVGKSDKSEQKIVNVSVSPTDKSPQKQG